MQNDKRREWRKGVTPSAIQVGMRLIRPGVLSILLSYFLPGIRLHCLCKYLARSRRCLRHLALLFAHLAAKDAVASMHHTAVRYRQSFQKITLTVYFGPQSIRLNPLICWSRLE